MFTVPIYHDGALIGFATIMSDGRITFDIPATQSSRDMIQLLMERHWNSFTLLLTERL